MRIASHIRGITSRLGSARIDRLRERILGNGAQHILARSRSQRNFADVTEPVRRNHTRQKIRPTIQ